MLVAQGLGLVKAQTSHYGDFYGLRPLTAAQALLMLFGFALLTMSTKRSGRNSVLAALLGISVVLAQHRSVWLSLLVVLALLAIRGTRSATRVKRGPIIAVSGSLILAITLPAAFGINILPTTSQIAAEPGLPDVVTSTRSTNWRWEMWTTRIEAPRPAENTLFGGVFGVTPVKVPGTRVMNPGNSAHNMAVDTYVMLGLVGLVLTTVLVAMATLFRQDRLAPDAILLWGLVTFGVFYNWPSWGWLILGSALSLRGLDSARGHLQGKDRRGEVTSGIVPTSPRRKADQAVRRSALYPPI
jgi:O-antigen ligase